MTHSQKIRRLEKLSEEPLVCEFYALSADVESSERENHPMDLPTIPEAMKFRREQMLENQREISLRAGMSLNRSKQLESGRDVASIGDARNLYAVGIPASVLLAR